MLRTDPPFQASEHCVKLYWSLVQKGRRCSSGMHSLLDIAFFFGGLFPFGQQHGTAGMSSTNE